MLTRILKKTIFFLILLILSNDLSAQTSEWRVFWQKNADEDSVDYYLLYRKIGSTPSVNDPALTQVPEPTSPGQGTVAYIDNTVLPGQHYFYRVQAVNLRGQSSTLSADHSAAIPQINFENLLLQIDTTYIIDLNQAGYVNDPDNQSSALSWTVTGGSQNDVSINPSNNQMTIVTGSDTLITEIFHLTVIDPDGFFDKKDFSIELTKAAVAPPPPPPPPPPPSDEGEVVKAYPIPYLASNPPPCDCIVFDIPQSMDAKQLLIYTVMGDLVFSESNLSMSYNWNIENSHGKKLSPGLYIYYILNDNGDRLATGKLVIIR